MCKVKEYNSSAWQSCHFFLEYTPLIANKSLSHPIIRTKIRSKHSFLC